MIPGDGFCLIVTPPWSDTRVDLPGKFAVKANAHNCPSIRAELGLQFLTNDDDTFSILPPAYPRHQAFPSSSYRWCTSIQGTPAVARIYSEISLRAKIVAERDTFMVVSFNPLMCFCRWRIWGIQRKTCKWLDLSSPVACLWMICRS